MYVPKNRLSYHLECEGVVIASLEHPRTQLMDLDVAYVLPLGGPEAGGRLGASLQLPTGRREDFSGSGGTDGLLGGAAWKRWGPWRLHGQAEWVLIGLPRHSPYGLVLASRHFTRAWVGAGWRGDGQGLLGGLGLDITFAYSQNPYRTGIARIDGPALQQHWTFTHRALPRWRFGFSEEAGSYVVPDITGFAAYQF